MVKITKVRLLDVQYAENLERNIISYGILEAKGFGIAYMGDHRVVGNIDSGVVIFDVDKKNNVLTVRDHDRGGVKLPSDVLMTALAQSEIEVSQDVQQGTLMNFHRRLAHLNYDTILRMAKDPAFGIQLIDETRADCLACAQGKQTNNQQSRKDTSKNAPNVHKINHITISKSFARSHGTLQVRADDSSDNIDRRILASVFSRLLVVGLLTLSAS